MSRAPARYLAWGLTRRDRMATRGNDPKVAQLGAWTAPPRERLADVVANKLTEDIAAGTIQPGSRLPNEQELSQHFSVGKSVLREAMKIVVTRGLVVVQQGYGTIVNHRSQWNLNDPAVIHAMRYHLSLSQLVEVRRHLEPEMAKLAALRANETDLASLRALIERQDQQKSPKDVALWSLEFHEAIAEATHNPIYSILTSSLRALMQAKLTDDLTQQSRGERPTAETVEANHAVICEAIAAGDPERAQQAALAHLDQLAPHWEWLAAESGWNQDQPSA